MIKPDHMKVNKIKSLIYRLRSLYILLIIALITACSPTEKVFYVTTDKVHQSFLQINPKYEYLVNYKPFTFSLNTITIYEGADHRIDDNSLEREFIINHGYNVRFGDTLITILVGVNHWALIKFKADTQLTFFKIETINNKACTISEINRNNETRTYFVDITKYPLQNYQALFSRNKHTTTVFDTINLLEHNLSIIKLSHK